MPHGLLVSIHFHDGRYHGHPEWPPSPARLFQALIAGAAKGNALSAEDRDALAWLEQLTPPIISAPAVRRGRGFKNYVPNNDLDAVGGDPGRVSEIRAPKLVRPLLFDAREPLLYAWRFDGGETHARRICAMAGLLYQLGRGIDMAWARGEIVEEREVEPRIAENRGAVYRPSSHGDGMLLSCPFEGSLESLELRFAQTRARLALAGGKEALFSQPPQPRFAAVPYDSPPDRRLFDFRKEMDFAPWPLTRVVTLVETIRDRAAERLKEALPESVGLIDRILIGRGAEEADKSARVRIVPLPSIGSPYVVPSIRRVLTEIPANCPLPADDLAWAFSGLDVVDPETGEVKGNLVSADDRGMLKHYGIDVRNGHQLWRTVTPAALPSSAARRRIDPVRLSHELTIARKQTSPNLTEAKGSEERLREEQHAGACVVQALRHAGIVTRPESIRVQREPFQRNGARAESFASGLRFIKERLWHLEVVFAEPVQGPLLIGDGRYLGLGVMEPVRNVWREIVVFAIAAHANITAADAPALVQAARRALMALSRDVTGEVSRLFSGHEDNGGPAASGSHEHVFLAADDANGDGRIDRLMVAAPWMCDHSIKSDQRLQEIFDRVVSRLQTIRAGPLGVIGLGSPDALPDGDALVGPARLWETRTPYRATRHAKRRQDPKEVIIRDILAECARRKLPLPEVEIAEWKAMPQGGGLTAHGRLRFASAIRGPLLLGRDSHKGGGMFACLDDVPKTSIAGLARS
jgi:CRISPR-associated protein Csb2